MGAATQLAIKKVLQNLVPLNALTAVNLEKIARKTHVENIRNGAFIFKQGDRDNESVYLLQGSLVLVNDNQVIEEIDSDAQLALHPIAHSQPRQISARAEHNVVVARIDSNLLDVMLTWDQSSGYEVSELGTEADSDWMTKILQSRALQKLPPANIQKLLMRMDELQVKKGQSIVQQGEMGNDYYIIKKGHCHVTRKNTQGGSTLLAKLQEGDSFGEEALLSNDKRNADVIMLSDGVLMHLAKSDFLELLKLPLVNQINYQQAALMGVHGAVWLDVRLPEEFEHGNITHSINIPLAQLRNQLDALDREKLYIAYCDTGRRSATAAFLLSQRGFDVQTLNNGIASVPQKKLSTIKPAPATAEIIAFKNSSPRSATDIATETSRDGQISKLQSEISKLTQKLNHVEPNEQDAKKIREETHTQQKTIVQLEREADANQALFDKRLVNLNSKLKKHDSVVSRLRTQLRDSDRKFNELNIQAQQELASTNKHEAQFKQSAETIAELTEKLQLAHQEKQLSVQSKAKWESQLDALNETKTQKNSFELKWKTAQSKISSLQKIKKDLKEDHFRKDKQILQLNSQLDALTDEKHTLLEKNTKNLSVAQTKITEHTITIEKKSAEINQLHAERDQLNERIHVLGEQNAQNNQIILQLKTREGEWAEAQERIQAYQIELEGLSEEFAHATEHAQNNSLTEQQFKTKADQMQIQMQKLAEGEQHIQSDLDGVHLRLRESLRDKAQSDVAKDDAEKKLHALENATKKNTQSATDNALRAEYDTAKLSAELALANKELSGLQIKLQAANDHAITQHDQFNKKLAKQAQKSARETQRQLAELHNEQDTDSDELTEQFNQSLEKSKNELKKTTTRLKKIQNKLTEAEKKQISSAQELKQVKTELTVYKTVAKQTQPTISQNKKPDDAGDDLDSLFNNNVIPEINTQVNTENNQEDVDSFEWMTLDETYRVLAKNDNNIQQKDLKIVHEAPPRKAPAAVGFSNSLAQKPAPFTADSPGSALPRATSLDSGTELLAKVRFRKRITKGLLWSMMLAIIGSSLMGGYYYLGKERITQYYYRLLPNKNTSENTSVPDIQSIDLDRLGWPNLTADKKIDKTTETTKKTKKIVAPKLRRTIANDKQKNRKPASTQKKPAPVKKIAKHRKNSPAKPITNPVSTTRTKSTSKLMLQAVPSMATEVVANAPKATNIVPPIITQQNLVTAKPGFQAHREILANRPRLIYQDRLRDGGKGPVLAEIPGGQFVIGNKDPQAPQDEQPAHQVSVKSFSMSRFETSFAEYDQFATTTGRMLPNDQGWGRNLRPVINVSWYDAKAYADWLSLQSQRHYRLPSESEWELAAAATSELTYTWGDEIGVNRANCFNCASQWDGKQSAPVGSFGANHFGLYDTAGNVMEWVEDCYNANYHAAPSDGKPWRTGDCSRNIVRGGAFLSTADGLRTTKRVYYPPSSKLDGLGMRLVREH